MADDAQALADSLKMMAEAGVDVAVVEQAFSAKRPTQLSVVPGQIVEVTDRSNASWWMVSTEEGEGYVPTGCLSDVGASVEAMMHDIHVHMDAADVAQAELDHHEQLHAVMDAEHEQTLLQINEHRAHLAQIGVDHDLQLPSSAPSGFHFFRSPHHHVQGTVLTPEQLYEAVPHLGPDSMVCRIGVDDGWLVLATLPDFVELTQSAAPTPRTHQRAVDEDDAASSASSEWEEELEAVDQSLAEEAVEKAVQSDWRRHTLLGVMSRGHIGPSSKWQERHRKELEERLGVTLTDNEYAEVRKAVAQAEAMMGEGDFNGANEAISHAEELEHMIAKQEVRGNA